MKALVWYDEQGQLCRHCGTYTWEWQYQDAEGVWQRRDDIAREADYWTCMGCREMQPLQRQAKEHGGAGVQVRWFPRQQEARAPHLAGLDSK